jgi:hypothetical protein
LRDNATNGDQGAKMLADAPANATYLHGTSQNEMLGIIGRKLRNQELEKVQNLDRNILKKPKFLIQIKSARFFSIMSDEANKFSHEYLTLCIVDTKTLETNESFLGYLVMKETTGKAGRDNTCWLRLHTKYSKYSVKNEGFINENVK